MWEKLKIREIENDGQKNVLIMNLENLHFRDKNIVHGGAIGTFIDFSMNRLGDGQINQYKINFIRVGEGSLLKACSEKIISSPFGPIFCEIFNENGKVIANGIGSALNYKPMISDTMHQMFHFHPEDNRKNLPEHVFEEGVVIPFNEYLGIKQTYWGKGVAEIELPVHADLTVHGMIPNSHLITLADVSCGQALKTLLKENENLLTIELSVTVLRDFQNTKKFIARGKVLKLGRISVIICIIIDENCQIIAHGSSSYYVK